MKSTALTRPAPAARVTQQPGTGPAASADSLGAASAAAQATAQASSQAVSSMGSVAVLVLADLQPAHRLWAWARLVLGSRVLRHTPGLRFAKVLGSGAGGGFGLRPSGTHRGLFLGFADEGSARQFMDHAPALAAYRSRARECCVLLLRAYASKGAWDGAALALTALPPDASPGQPPQVIAALTRASIKPRHALPFWRLSPPAEVALQGAEGCLMAVGLGEAPLLRQATFSLWSSAQAMDRYARSGAHQQAIRSAYAGGYFAESMFVRFLPIETHGSWQGQALQRPMEPSHA